MDKLITTEHSALFADSTYNMNGKKKREDKYNKINEEIKNTGYEVVPKFTNKGMVLYQNKEDPSKIHLSHTGTSLRAKSGFKDVIADLAIGAGLTSHNNTFKKRDRQTRKIINHYEKEHGDNLKLSASGHSLGGSTISNSSKNKKVLKYLKQLDTFNMGSSPGYNEEIKPNEKQKKILDPITTHHRIKKDIISASLKVNNPFGKVKTYKIPFDKKEESKSILNRMKLNNPLIDNIKNFTEDALHAHHSSHFHDGTVKYDE